MTLTDQSTDADAYTCGMSGPGALHINWGDGSRDDPVVDLGPNPSGYVIQHDYGRSGTWTLRFIAEDNQLLRGTAPNQPVTIP